MSSRLALESVHRRLLSLTCTRFHVSSQANSTITAQLQNPSPKIIEESSSTKTNDIVSHEKVMKLSTTAYDIHETHPEEIRRIANEIRNLSFIEVIDLYELLKKKEKEENKIRSQATAPFVFKVYLVKYDETKKIPVIREVKDVVDNINLIQAKKLVESVPQILCHNLTKEDAERVKAKIEAVGGECVIE